MCLAALPWSPYYPPSADKEIEKVNGQPDTDGFGTETLLVLWKLGIGGFYSDSAPGDSLLANWHQELV